MVTHPDEEIDHEEDIEGQVDLLCCALWPGCTWLNAFTPANTKMSVLYNKPIQDIVFGQYARLLVT